MWKVALGLQAVSSSLGPQRNPCVIIKNQGSLSRAEKWYSQHMKWLLLEWVAVCRNRANFPKWPWPPRNLHLLGTEGDQTQKQILKGLGKDFHPDGTWQWRERPRAIAWLSSVTVSQPNPLQHTCCRGCLGNAIGICQASTNEKFLPAAPATGESSAEPGSMTDAVAYQGHKWQLAPLCPTFEEGSPNTAAVQDSLSNSSDSKHTKEVP